MRVLSSKTTSWAEAPSLLSTDTVAFGASLAKSPVVHSSSRASVGRCPDALTGRSANTIEVGLTPVNVRVWPCRLAPRAFMTNSDGTMSTFTDDLPGGDVLGAAVAGVWASAIAGIHSKAPMEIATKSQLIAQLPSDKRL